MIVKRVAWVLPLFVIGVVIFVVVALRSPFLMQQAIKFLIQKNCPGYIVNDLTIGRQKWIPLGELQLSNVLLTVSSQDVRWAISVINVQVQDLHRILFSRIKVPVRIEGISIVQGPVLINTGNAQCEFDFANRSLMSWRARISAEHLQLQKYQMTRLSAQVDGAKQVITIKDFTADVYEGFIKAGGTVQLVKPLGYKALVQFKGVNLDLLYGINNAVYQQIQGVMDAELSFEGRGNYLQVRSFTVNMIKNVKLRAALLQFVVPYIPPTQDLAEFQELIRKDLKVSVEKADLNLKNSENQKLMGAIHLGVRKVNLDLNLPIDILFDGSLISLMQWYQRFVH
ncbi:MAG: hypothetical protein JNN05_03240 [Candidatus Omnitrophica bacterium]|nr:hypothetical protein [Candidatus Omnitrophota bacterium]